MVKRKTSKSNKSAPRLRIDLTIYFHGKSILKYRKITLTRAKKMLKDINKKFNWAGMVGAIEIDAKSTYLINTNIT